LRIVNTGKEPYEWTFDGKIFGPLQPGEVKDYPFDVANHAITRSAVRDEIGNAIVYTVKTLGEVKQDPELFQRIVTYSCPFVESEQCTAPPFRSLDALRAHMEKHFDSAAASKSQSGEDAQQHSKFTPSHQQGKGR
jgi:hypothetical protein